MLDLDIRIDTELRERAVSEAQAFVSKYNWPVSRSQIAGLLQIACNEPGKVSDFAGKQKERAEKRLIGMREGEKKTKLENEVELWKLVTNLSTGEGAKVPWSLKQQCEQDMPPHLKNLKKPHGSASPDERNNHNRLSQEKRERERQWNRDHYPGFFRHFCAEYLCHMPPEKGESS